MKKRKARYLKLVCLGVLGTYAGASYYNSEPLIAQEETETSHEKPTASAGRKKERTKSIKTKELLLLQR